MNLVWFRNDLRLADNPALSHALDSDKDTIAIYILNPEQHQIHGEAPHKLKFIQAHVNDLISRLEKLNIPLIVETAPTFEDVSAVFKTVVKNHKINHVFWNENYWVNEIKRDEQIEELLASNDIEIHQYHANYLLHPGTVTKDDGSMYQVFTPYKTKYIDRIKADYQQPLSVPDSQDRDTGVESSDVIEHQFIQESVGQDMVDMWPIGEVAANQRLKSFTQDNDYKEERDYPAIDGTSSLSPYLAIGVISAKQCLAHMLKEQGESAFESTWVSELIWRDFYNDLMFHFPKLAKHKTFKEDAVDYWQQDKCLFKAWQQGKTGFPIIDAGMRQLLQEGWMHNRVRMLVASFLTKLCLIDWRQGEAHFMAHLLDGDLASNNGGWQWSSATGCDAAPYFRIFNPTTQSKKFDPDGTYIRTYVHELKYVEAKEIHDPKVEIRKNCDYPNPVIDYKAARANALSWFKDNPMD